MPPTLFAGGNQTDLGIAAYTGLTTGASNSKIGNSSLVVNNNGAPLAQPAVASMGSAIPTATTVTPIGGTVFSTPTSTINVATQDINSRNVGMNSGKTVGSATAAATTWNKNVVNGGVNVAAATLSSNNTQATGSVNTAAVTGGSGNQAVNNLVTGNFATSAAVPIPIVPPAPIALT